MYTEYNGYSVYNPTFNFSGFFENGKTYKVDIDCLDNGYIHLNNDVSQGAVCLGSGTIVSTDFIINTDNEAIILESQNYIDDTSFGRFTATEIQETSTSIFKTEDDAFTFYKTELGFIFVIIICILFYKLFR